MRSVREGDPTMMISCVRISIVLMTVCMLMVGHRIARAACTPFGDDDGGCMTSNKDASKCEQKASANGATLAKAIIKCHAVAAAKAFKAKPFDEEACEDAATK